MKTNEELREMVDRTINNDSDFEWLLKEIIDCITELDERFPEQKTNKEPKGLLSVVPFIDNEEWETIRSDEDNRLSQLIENYFSNQKRFEPMTPKTTVEPIIIPSFSEEIKYILTNYDSLSNKEELLTTCFRKIYLLGVQAGEVKP